jgi:hypothetical protein
MDVFSSEKAKNEIKKLSISYNNLFVLTENSIEKWTMEEEETNVRKLIN